MGLGDYDVNVLLYALSTRGLDGEWFDARMPASRMDLGGVIGMLVNGAGAGSFGGLASGNHWYAIRRIDGQWFDLNSMHRAPRRFLDSGEMLNDVSRVLSAGGAVIRIKPLGATSGGAADAAEAVAETPSKEAGKREDDVLGRVKAKTGSGTAAGGSKSPSAAAAGISSPTSAAASNKETKSNPEPTTKAQSDSTSVSKPSSSDAAAGGTKSAKSATKAVDDGAGDGNDGADSIAKALAKASLRKSAESAASGGGAPGSGEPKRKVRSTEIWQPPPPSTAPGYSTPAFVSRVPINTQPPPPAAPPPAAGPAFGPGFGLHAQQQQPSWVHNPVGYGHGVPAQPPPPSYPQYPQHAQPTMQPPLPAPPAPPLPPSLHYPQSTPHR